MVFHLFHIITFLTLVVVGTNCAILPPQLYWKSILPNTPMPKAITNLLQPADTGMHFSNVDVGNDGRCDTMCLSYYKNVASESQLHDKSTVALFFFENDLHYGKKLSMQLMPKTTNGPKFLPKEVADSIPFSSNKMENILDKFSIKKGSKEHEIVKNTINECEEKGIKGEEKLCVTSLESMVDFAISKLGKNVEVVSTEMKNESNELHEYVIEKEVKRLGDKNQTMVCHIENYFYAVFYCHKMHATNAYSVPLKGIDGNRVKAIAVCHTDTSQWNPKHISLQVLKVQPGTVPVCHFLPQGHVVWVSK